MQFAQLNVTDKKLFLEYLGDLSSGRDRRSDQRYVLVTEERVLPSTFRRRSVVRIIEKTHRLVDRSGPA